MKLIEQKDLRDIVKDGDSLATTGFTTSMLCDYVFRGIEKSFIETGHPKDLELISVPMLGIQKPHEGMDCLSHKGLLRGLRTCHINMAPEIQAEVMNNEIYCMMYPYGCIVQLYRDMGAGKPGIISKVGLGTFIDPRIEGGRCNALTKDNVCELMEIHGEDYLFYPKFNIDVAVLRGTSIDKNGNVTMEEEAVLAESMEIAQAVKRNGGIVIVQAKYLVENGTLKPREVSIPGIMVDYAIIAPTEYHMQTMVTEMNPEWTHKERSEKVEMPEVTLDVRKIMARRAAMEIEKGTVINLGIGVPEIVGAVANEEGFAEDITMTVECGHVGGVPANGLNFGGCYNPEYVTNPVRQMDFYDGGGLDACVLSAAEVDRFGNTNVTKFGRIVGPGGYINIATGAGEAVFCGTLTAGGLEVKAEDGKLVIVNEGSKKKYVPDVEQITYSGKQAARRGQKVTYVTERAVFVLRNEVSEEEANAGEPMLELIEIAPGIDLQSQVLDQIGFEVKISSDLKEMDPRIFKDEPMGYRP